MSIVAVLSNKGLGFSNLSQVLRKRDAFVPAAAAAADGELELFAGVEKLSKTFTDILSDFSILGRVFDAKLNL
ncbi:hypothetical protein QQ045_000346 [Rhodiola kirilowii]